MAGARERNSNGAGEKGSRGAGEGVGAASLYDQFNLRHLRITIARIVNHHQTKNVIPRWNAGCIELHKHNR